MKNFCLRSVLVAGNESGNFDSARRVHRAARETRLQGSGGGGGNPARMCECITQAVCQLCQRRHKRSLPAL